MYNRSRSAIQCFSVGSKHVSRQYSGKDYVLSLVRRHDYESYVTSLLYPQDIRYPALILHAFNTEIAVVSDKVTEQTAGYGRYNFWKRCITEIFEGDSTPAEHPLIFQLHVLINNNPKLKMDSSKRLFYNLVEARHRLCAKQHQFRTLDELLKYSDQTKGSLYKLLSLFTSAHESQYSYNASQHYGRCSGILTSIRSAPYLIKQGQLSLPQDVLRQHGIRDKDVVNGGRNVAKAVEELSALASSELELALTNIQSLKPDDRIIYLPIYQSQRVLNLIKDKCRFNVYDERLQNRTSYFAWRVWYDKLRLGRL